MGGVEDVISTGASTLTALEKVEVTGATIVGAIPLVDRGDAAGKVIQRLRSSLRGGVHVQKTRDSCCVKRVYSVYVRFLSEQSSGVPHTCCGTKKKHDHPE